MRINPLRWPIIMLLCLFAGAPPTATGAARERPNIIFILADDLGYGDLGVYGQKRIQTPHLDRMAAEGMRFTQFYAGSPVCAPSRSVLMTGLHTGHTTVRGNARVPLRPEDVTVAEVLKSAGYATGLVGKWGLGDEGTSGIPTKQGFDAFYGYLNQTHAHNYYPSFLVRNEERVKLRNIVPDEGKMGQGVASEKVDYSHDLFTAEALDYVDHNRDKPFFLYLAYTIPHTNNEAKANGMEVPDFGTYADKDWPDSEKAFAAMITRMDRDIGRLLERLKRNGIDDDTLVLFTSDNGPHKEGGHNPEFFDSNGLLRGIKRDLYDGGIRVPMIARWPGKIRTGSVTDRIGYFADFMPTAAIIAGAKPPKNDGVSLLPTLLGKDRKRQPTRPLYWEFYEGGTAQAARMGDWKAVRKPIGGPVELYDLSNDPGEARNLAGEHPRIARKLTAFMDGAHTSSPHWKTPEELRNAGGAPAGRKRARENRRQGKPNIVLIFADDLGYGDLGSYGATRIRTPNLDQIAAEGARFTDFYASAPVCTPSRAGLLTGRYPIRSGLTHVLFPRSRQGIDAGEVTLAEALKAQGYATACIGKWHLGHLPPFLPTRHGFDRYFGIPYSNDMKPTPLLRGEEVVEEPADQAALTGRYTDEAIRFIREQKDGPFFLYLPHTFPHVPLFASERFRGRSAGGLYGDVVEEIDWSAGEILKTLKELGLERDTLVIFTSDNGPWLIQKAHGGSAGWLRNGKGTTYEGGIRVPFIARWPGRISAGKVVQAPAMNVDLYPTFVRLAGGRPHADRPVDGRDIGGLLTGKGERRGNDFFFFRGERLEAIRSGRWKLHLPRKEKEKLRPDELYDLSADVDESDNLAGRHPEVVERLTRKAQAFDTEVRKGASPLKK